MINVKKSGRNSSKKVIGPLVLSVPQWSMKRLSGRLKGGLEKTEKRIGFWTRPQAHSDPQVRAFGLHMSLAS